MSCKCLNMVLVLVTVMLIGVIAVQMLILYRYVRRDAFGRITMRQTVDWPQEQPIVVFFGDSRISQWKPMPQIQGYRLMNLGQNGLTSSQLLFQLLHLDLPKNVKGAVIQIGINDLKTIGMAPQKADAIVIQCKTNMSECLDLLRQKDIHCVLIPVIPAAKPDIWRRPIWSSRINMAVLEVNDYLKNIQEDQVTVPDLGTICMSSGQLKPDYRLNTLHLNTAGYQALNQQVSPVLNTTFVENQD